MKLFRPLYEMALRWAAHRHAERYLAGVSFVEAFIFPVAPEFMLAPMTLAKPRSWARFAAVSLIFSLLGALVGYAIGHYAIDSVTPLLQRFGYWDKYLEVRQLAAEKGFWMLLVAGFIPVPLKIFTLASGAVDMPLLPFLAGMLVGRGKRVFLVTGAIRLGGARAEQWLRRWIEWIGWAVVALLIAVVIYFKYIY
jgi:membrane protein YqaA with SNARE-associated domain